MVHFGRSYCACFPIWAHCFCVLLSFRWLSFPFVADPLSYRTFLRSPIFSWAWPLLVCDPPLTLTQPPQVPSGASSVQGGTTPRKRKAPPPPRSPLQVLWETSQWMENTSLFGLNHRKRSALQYINTFTYELGPIALAAYLQPFTMWSFKKNQFTIFIRWLFSHFTSHSEGPAVL